MATVSDSATADTAGSRRSDARAAAPVTPPGGLGCQPTPRLPAKRQRATRPKICLSFDEYVPENICSEVAYPIVKKLLQVTQDAEVVGSMIMREFHVA